MQLVQIGVTKQKTIMDLIQEMAANQFSGMCCNFQGGWLVT
jgi:hypothetical protein